jgi:hypothetical protein
MSYRPRVRSLAILAMVAACGARAAAPRPLANRGGGDPADPPVRVLDGHHLLLDGGEWLDEPTAVTLVVDWPTYGEGSVEVDGRSVGSAGMHIVVPTGRHKVVFELPGE